MLLISFEMSRFRMVSFQQEGISESRGEEDILKMLTTHFLKLWSHA